MPALCRECLTEFPERRRCPVCRSPRALAHPELRSLAVAHLDADAFYASVEKRDDPSLRDRPVIVGGGKRGVVTTACYIARVRGVRSAMPMFKALALCPDAAVVRPRIGRYADVSRRMRALMLELTPLVEPLSLDEAFLDLSGTDRLHGAPPAVTLARLQRRIEDDLGLTVSVGLSYNKFLAKIASDLGKPRGFSLIGREEAGAFLAGQPVNLIWGVGPAAARSLARDGICTIADLRARDRETLVRRFGELGDRLWHLARGEDGRHVVAERGLKSISHETTFETDLADLGALSGHLRALAEAVSARAKARDMAGRVVALKLRRADFGRLARRQTLEAPTGAADRLYRTALAMLRCDMHQAPFRLIGIGLSGLASAASPGPIDDLFDRSASKRLGAEQAVDRIRARFGPGSIGFGRADS
jgi:DNA polymerase-4